MKNKKEKAQQLWKERYGDETIAKDFHGNYMHIEGYGKRDFLKKIDGHIVKCGWNLHHKKPKSLGGGYTKDNLICTNIITNEMAGNKTTYWIGGKKFQIKKIEKKYEICRLV